MQTFVASYNLEENAEILDNKRLFKQLLEGYQITNSLVNNKGWIHHPAVTMWRGHEAALYVYLREIRSECLRRGIGQDSTLLEKCRELTKNHPNNGFPAWWNRSDILSSHKSRLKCKGLIDSLAAAIKKKYKIKCFDDWSEVHFKRTKNELRFEDVKKLRSFLTIGENALISNYYDQFGWSEPLNLLYIWP
jgi:hypothetical protein